MGLRVDFTDVPDTNGLPVGDYRVKVTDGELRHGQKSGDPYVNWELTVQEGPMATRKTWTNTTLVGEGRAYGIKPLLKACGIPTDDSQEFNIHADESEPDVPAVVGHELIVTVKKQKDSDDTEVKRFKKLDAESAVLP